MCTASPPSPPSACLRHYGAALLPAVAAVVLLADQASKLWIQQHFAACDDSSLPLVPGWLAFAYTCNKGAAFGLLANEALLFVLIALVVIGVLVAYVRFLPANRQPRPAGSYVAFPLGSINPREARLAQRPDRHQRGVQ
jgi:lipoprotein signal peptidase